MEILNKVGVQFSYFFRIAHVTHASGGVLRSTHSLHTKDARTTVRPYRILTRLTGKSVVLSLHHADSITNGSLAAAAANVDLLLA